jgi:hypothetical protein
VLQSIDLTQLPAATSRAELSTGASEPAVEYSSREVSPPALLVQQLVRAHAIFLLHHGSTLEDMFAKHKRDKFCNILDTYWTPFASNWDVLLHGSPAVDLYGGMKLAAGGELGMGVGEEEWGSSERDVLEDFARRTDGLVDVMVSRFSDASPPQQAKSSVDPKTLDVSDTVPWVGSGSNVNAADGVVFSGLGAVSRKSLRDLSHWIETIYSHGDQAYGIRDNPTSDRRKRRRRNHKPSPSPTAEARSAPRNQRPQRAAPHLDAGLPPGIPPPIVKAAETSLDKASAAVDTAKANDHEAPVQESGRFLASLGDTETWTKYMTLGYGTAWGGGKKPQEGDGLVAKAAPPAPHPAVTLARKPSPAAMRYIDPEPDVDVVGLRLKTQIRQENDGYFLIGLTGEMKDIGHDDENDEGSWNNRIPLRTIHVEINRESGSFATSSVGSDDTPAYEKELNSGTSMPNGLSRLRPVVYLVCLNYAIMLFVLTAAQHRPFIYTFLFHHRTGALSLSSFYRDLHNFFSPLHRPLDKSTSPDRVAARLSAASNPYTTISSRSGSAPETQPIYDLVYDPRTLTVHSSLPNIPDPGTLITEGLSSTSTQASGWSRVEALNVHSQILATITSTRRNLSEIERTCKTSRSWWVVWMRLPPSRLSNEEAVKASDSANSSMQFNTDDLREAFLVRRARDTAASTPKSSGSRLASGMWAIGLGNGGSQKMGGLAAGWGPKGLGEGIGIDARKYIEELLSLNR